MKKLLTIVLLTIAIFSFFKLPVKAASCPSYMDPSSVECLDYLRDQLNDLSNENKNIKNQISDEEYKQLSLSQKLEYIENQIVQTEKVIQSLEIEIAAHNIEISILEDEIEKAEDSIALSKQEINQLESTVNQRVTESYKYSFVGALEIFLDTRSFDSVLRKVKYLISTREKDAQQLEQYTNLVDELNIQEDELIAQREDLQSARIAMEEEQENLLVEKDNLDSQRDERERLLVESKRRAAELEAQYVQNVKKLSDLDAAILEYIDKYGDQAVNQGYVSKGTWIGRMGNTGSTSTGAHLHFSMKNSHSGNPCRGDIPLLSGYLVQGDGSWITGWDGWVWPYMYAGTLPLPIAGPYVIMSQNYHTDRYGTYYAIDLISYKIDYTKNFGAPIYAVKPGELYKATDGFGGNYAYIHHPDGTATCYLHIQ
jgi:peptidoglycan hydrolase CwlO-like protein